MSEHGTLIMSFKFNAKQLFLTYPQCTLSKEFVLEKLQQITAIKTYTIAQEAHADGTPHVHALILFEKRYHTTSSRAFDIEGFHPNVKSLKTTSDFKRVHDYVCKDKNFITTYVARTNPTELLGKRILEEGLTPQVVYENPALLFKNFNSIRSWVNFTSSVHPRPLSRLKKRHIWLYGNSNTGKSTWFRMFKPLYVCKELPENNDFSHLSQDVEILYADEYRGFLTVQQLNKICDGDTRLNTKGGSFDLHEVIVIIISNYSIRDVYKNLTNEILETLYNRFNEFDSSIKMPPIPLYSLKI